mgnify:CR=1 FL=1
MLASIPCENDSSIRANVDHQGAIAHVRDEMVARLQLSSIAFGALNSVEDFSVHPQLKRREVTLQSGKTAQLVAPPIEHSYDLKSATFGRVPSIGEHADAIRAEFAKPLNRL